MHHNLMNTGTNRLLYGFSSLLTQILGPTQASE